MSNASDLFGAGGSKPKLITQITSGTGTYIPTVDKARCLVFVQAAGSNGLAAVGGQRGDGGAAGAMVSDMVRVPIAGAAWVVGASGVNGAPSIFGYIRAQASRAPREGGVLGGGSVAGSSSPFTLYLGGRNGVSGGAGGAGSSGEGTAGSAAGFPDGSLSNQVPNGSAQGGAASSGGGGGGDSAYGFGGKGGTTGATAGAAGTGYGSGGGGGGGTAGAGGLGKGGYIEIWDFGA